MNKYLKWTTASLAVVLLVAFSAWGVFAQSGDALVRYVHVIPGASAIDVYTDGQLTISGLEFGAASGYIHTPAGDHQLTVTQAGSTSPIWEQSLSLAAESATTLIAASPSEASFQVYPDDLSPLPLGRARFTAVYAVAGGSEVDLLLSDGRPVIPALVAGTPAGTLDVPVFTYDFVVVPSGGAAADALVTPDSLPLNTGTSYVLVIYGTADSPETLVLTAPTTADVEGGLLRVLHGVGGAPAVDIYLNDTLAASSLEFGVATEHITVPAGDYDVAIRGAGSDADLLNASVTVEAGQALTVAALGTPDAVSAQVWTDDLEGIDPTEARIVVVNGIPDQPNLTASLADGTSLGTDIAFGNASAPVDVAPSIQGISVFGVDDASAELPDQAFYGGVYYTFIALEDGGAFTIVSQDTSLNQSIASAPTDGGTSIALEPPPVETTAAPTEAVVAAQPTAVPTEAPVVEAQPTVAPVQATAAPAGPTGRVFNLNPDANLQLRQYPNTSALSLGTVPPGTVLAVVGREGGIEPIPFSATPDAPEDYEFIDPVTLLADPEKDDLVPEETWLFVTYTTPDGGAINAWANALYVDVRDTRGDRMRLAELPLVPGNTPGEAVNTAVTPPPVPVNRVAVTIFNLDAGVNLNIRRVPQTTGEVLARVPNGTVMEFLGINEAGDWVFVSYTPPEGGTVTGWVDTDYVQYSFNNRPIDLEEMETRNLLVITPDDERGQVTAGIAPAGVPTANPIRDAIVAEVVLDTGSNLNLRRNPNVNAEVLIQIPAGTQVIVNGRTEDGFWLNVTFEDIDGWIAARTETAIFVRLTRNGEEVEFLDVPIFTGEVISPSTAATATPEEDLDSIPATIGDDVVAMTGSPGGDNQGLPILSKGQEVTILFTDGVFSYIELPDGTRGWVPAGAAVPK